MWAASHVKVPLTPTFRSFFFGGGVELKKNFWMGGLRTLGTFSRDTDRVRKF